MSNEKAKIKLKNNLNYYKVKSDLMGVITLIFFILNSNYASYIFENHGEFRLFNSIKLHLSNL